MSRTSAVAWFWVVLIVAMVIAALYVKNNMIANPTPTPTVHSTTK